MIYVFVALASLSLFALGVFTENRRLVRGTFVVDPALLPDDGWHKATAYVKKKDGKLYWAAAQITKEEKREEKR